MMDPVTQEPPVPEEYFIFFHKSSVAGSTNSVPCLEVSTFLYTNNHEQKPEVFTSLDLKWE